MICAIYLIWVQTLEYYFEAKGCSNEESFMITTQKLQGYVQYCFKYLRKEIALQGKHSIKSCSWLKLYMNVRFNIDQLFEEEPLKEELVIKIKIPKEEECKEENEIIFDLEEKEVESKPTWTLCYQLFLKPTLVLPIVLI